MASPLGTLNRVDSWLEDFRKDLESIRVPTLVIHGDSDRIVPLEASGSRMPEFVPDAKLVVVQGGRHGLNWTHAKEVNRELLFFLSQLGGRDQLERTA
jgi:non-heme chloroperoxidase